MPDEERVRTKRRKLDSIITKLHHATPPGRENLEEETKPDEAAQENVNADEGKETRPRLSRRKLHVAVKQKEVSDVLNVEALPEDKAQEQLSDNGVMEDEAWANSTKEDAENLICNGERDTDEKIEPECSTKGKTGPLESVDNTEDGFQKGLSEEAEKEDTQGGEIKRKRLHSEGSEADGGDYQAKVFVLDEELFANVVHPQSNVDDSTELQSEKPAAKQNDQVEKLKSSINSLSVNSISHDEQSHNDQSTNLDESSTTCKQSTEESGVVLTIGEKNSAVENLRDELLRSCVSPTKIELVQETLESENERHLCALKLLSCLFSKEELARSNTDGSYDKKCLDSQRLHLLKVLVFNKFPVPSGIEKDKEWKTIKGKINSKCRVARYSAKFVLMDEQLASNNGHLQESPVPDIFAKRKQRQKELKAKCKPERAKLNLSIDDQHSKDETTACTPDDDCDGERDSTCTSELLKQLDAKTDECERLRAKLHDSEEALRRQTNLQASAFEMLTTIKTCMADLESKMAAGFQRIEERLNGLEQASANAPTLLHGTISALCQNGMGQEIAQASSDGNLQTTIDLKELKTTPQPTGGSCVPLTSVERKHCFQNVSHELICSHVSPAKVKLVQETLEKESERHLCALKLLSCLFSKKELAISSTSGSNNKKCLDSQRLNSIKVLLFSRFPASSSVEREKEWKAIKRKINSKCRVAKFSSKKMKP